MTKLEWHIKNQSHNNFKCNVAFTSTYPSSKNDWYFDSGCFMQMTGEKTFLTNLNSCGPKHVIYGDDAKGKIIGK